MKHAKPLIRKQGEGTAYRVLGDTVTSVAETDGPAGWSLFEVDVPPGMGAPLHVHEGFDEGLYVLSGELMVTAAGKTITAGPGTFIYAPRGSEHAYENRGDAHARFLSLITPIGATAFFADMDREVGMPPDLDKLAEVTARHGLHAVR